MDVLLILAVHEMKKGANNSGWSSIVSSNRKKTAEIYEIGCQHKALSNAAVTVRLHIDVVDSLLAPMT